MNRFVLGIDFGTLSARCVLVDLAKGTEVGWAEDPYPHGVIERSLPGVGTLLPSGAARQDPADYLHSMRAAVRQVLADTGVKPTAIIGVGIDFTSCTVLPVFRDGRPVCWDPVYRPNPDAWVHLWKDQTAQAEATTLTQKAWERRESFLDWFGGSISADSFFPKVWQVLKRSPEVYAAADRFMEAGDWVVQQLTGSAVQASSSAAFKALWDGGYPHAFLAAVDPRLSQLVQEKMGSVHAKPGTAAGTLKPHAALDLGLEPGTTVAVANIDAHAALPGTGVAEPGKMVLVMGTSVCHMILGERLEPVTGICGAVKDGIVPGYIGYEAGQPAVGDTLSWFVTHFLPQGYHEAAQAAGVSAHHYLEQLAGTLTPGESGLLALDWWNGNRSPLANGDLSGLIFGLSLQTRPEDIYRALLEASAFGAFEIIATFEAGNVPVQEIFACGGIAGRSPLMMQILADVGGRRIHAAQSPRASALGAAVMASVAAGPSRGGHSSVPEAVRALTQTQRTIYEPCPRHHQMYQRLHAVYQELHRHFGIERKRLMQALREFRLEAKGSRAVVQAGVKEGQT